MNVVQCIQRHFKDEPDTIVWFDIFTINQNDAPNMDPDFWFNAFQSAIYSFRHTLLIASPWNKPVPFTRVWCLYEIYSTMKGQCKFEIIMPKKESASFMDSMMSGDISETLNTMIAEIDVLKSEAWSPDDKKKIFHIIKTTIGFDVINAVVHKLIREWTISTAKHALTLAVDVASQLHVKLVLADLFKHQGKFDLAQPLLEECLETNSVQQGEDHEETLTSMTHLALLHLQQGNYDESQNMHEKCLALRKVKLGEDHPDTLENMDNLATVHLEKGEYDLALGLLKNSVHACKHGEAWRRTPRHTEKHGQSCRHI
jgi:hypothetical protein